MCAGGHAASQSLKDQGKKVAGAEDKRVCPRTEARDVFTEYDDDPC